MCSFMLIMPMLLCDCQSFIKESYLLTYSCYGTGVGAAAI